MKCLVSIKSLLFVLIPCILVGCSLGGEKNQLPLEAQTIQLDVAENDVPGTVRHLWVEPMYDHVRVPASLDPEGVYYMPAHDSVVEIRQGKMQVEQFPADYDASQGSGLIHRGLRR